MDKKRKNERKLYCRQFCVHHNQTKYDVWNVQKRGILLLFTGDVSVFLSLIGLGFRFLCFCIEYDFDVFVRQQFSAAAEFKLALLLRLRVSVQLFSMARCFVLATKSKAQNVKVSQHSRLCLSVYVIHGAMYALMLTHRQNAIRHIYKRICFRWLASFYSFLYATVL